MVFDQFVLPQPDHRVHPAKAASTGEGWAQSCITKSSAGCEPERVSEQRLKCFSQGDWPLAEY
jgi:hypothetical protein